MKRDVYHRGLPGKKYGIWNNAKRCWQFGISEDTPMLAVARLYKILGNAAKQKIFEPRELPGNIGNMLTADLEEVIDGA